MSIPITYCLKSAAGRGCETAFRRLFDAMKYNLECGHFSQIPCNCDPRCPVLTDKEIVDLNNQLNEALGFDQ